MGRQIVASRLLPLQVVKSSNHKRWFLVTLLFALIYIVCALATTIPILRTEEVLPGTTWISNAIITITNLFHFPVDLHILQDHYSSQKATGSIEFFLLVTIIFSSYILYAFHLKRQKEQLLQSHQHRILLVIGITMSVVAFIYIFTPATISEDIYLYADYGRILVFHHANPYFVPPMHFSHDPVLPFVYWKRVLAIYGPIWMLVCAFLASFSSTVPLKIFITFRIFACIIHFINAFLVFSILRTLGCSTRTILLGTFLYALNPLILFESSLGGHNDILVAMFLLVGIFYAVRAEKKDEMHIIHYIPSLIAFTLAVLVKFTIIPVIILFVTMLFFKVSLAEKLKVRPMNKRLFSALSTALLASIICVIVAALFYGPFWIGHSMKAIVFIFSSQPPTTYSLSSLLSIAQLWNASHPLPAMLTPLTRVHTWNIITYGGMVLVMALGGIRLRYAPTTQNVIFVAMGTMAVFLLTTNWFTPWYIIWQLSFAVIFLSANDGFNGLAIRFKWSLIAFTFSFSFSAFMLDNAFAGYEGQLHPPHYGSLILSFIITFSLPLLVFFLFLIREPGFLRNQ